MSEMVSRRSLFVHAAGATAVAGAMAALATPAAYAQQATGSSLEKIGSSGRVRMGIAPAEPWAFFDAPNNEWKGFSVSFGNAIAEALGVELQISEMAFPSLIAGLQSDQIDFVPVLDGTPQRALAIDFTLSPLVFHALSVLVSEDLEVASWEDLNKAEVSIAVPQGSVMETYARRFAPNAEVLAFPNNPESVAAFQSGRATAAALFGPALTMLQQRVGSGKIVIPQPTRISQSQVGMQKLEDKSFRDWMDTSVSYFYATGEVTNWYNDFLEFRGIDPKTVPSVQRELW